MIGKRPGEDANGGAARQPPAARGGEPIGRAAEPPREGSYRILIVDDNRSIHEDFRSVLSGDTPADPELDDLAASLLGIESSSPGLDLRLDSAYRGEDAFAAVEKANEEGRPYALVFMDVRMQPGWSGAETAARLLEIDDVVHIILCTAYSARECLQEVKGLTTSDRVLLLKKPFDPIEVRQLANAMCNKWALALRDRRRMQDLERAVSEKTRALEAANEQLRREIAERARAERELSRARQLEGLGRLAAGLCHEINNPLTFIVGGIEAVDHAFRDASGALPQEKRDELEDLLRSVAVGADRITQIVRNVRLLSRQSDAEIGLVDVHASLDTAVDMVRPALSPHIALSIERDRGAPVRVLGRRLGLEQVLLNLLKNAIHALSDVPAGQAAITVRVQVIEGRARIAVADTGPGIEDEVLDKIFEPFFTTKPVNQGTGLGLSICHSLVSGMNGTIEVKSEPGRGTTFTVTLPVASSDPSAGAPKPEAAGSGAGKARGTVLVVDDERLVLKVLKHVLRDHEVTTASSVDDAMSWCARDDFDLILSDIMMPGASGCDFYHRLASARPGEERKIIFLTGGTMMEDVLTFLGRVPNLCLEKPVDPGALRALVAERIAARAAAG